MLTPPLLLIVAGGLFFLAGFHPQPPRSRSQTRGSPAEPERPGLGHLPPQHQPGSDLSDGRNAGTQHRRGHAAGGLPDHPASLRRPRQHRFILQRGDC